MSYETKAHHLWTHMQKEETQTTQTPQKFLTNHFNYEYLM